MAVNKKILDKKLKEYLERGIEFQPIKYTKDIPINLLSNYNNCGMTESYYCCEGINHLCWQELYEEGIWDKEIEDVKDDIRNTFKNIRKYLYNKRKYSPNRLDRMYIARDKDGACCIYIYLRDVTEIDYFIWFSNDI